MGRKIFTGQKDVFEIDPGDSPLTFGRASILWLAFDSSKTQVCVKAFRREYVRGKNPIEFVNEILARQNLLHPNILPILDRGAAGEVGNEETFIVLPYCRGGSLRDMMRERDFISPETFFPILEQVSSALDFSHVRGVIHGDIKPENILFLDIERSHVCLADFGMARLIPITEEVSSAEFSGAGSSAYLSPEQISRNQQSPLSDVYSLATVAYEALAGHLPFDTSAPPFWQMFAKIEGKVIHPRQANPRLEASISEGLVRSLDPKPESRPVTAGQMSKLLQGQLSLAELRGPKEHSGFWGSLPLGQRVALTFAIIGAIVAIATFFIKVVPDMFK